MKSTLVLGLVLFASGAALEPISLPDGDAGIGGSTPSSRVSREAQAIERGDGVAA
jgi:hypothetical protein